MKRFDINKLPKWAKEMIEEIEWNDGYSFDEDVLGQCWIKSGFQCCEGGHVFVFSNKDDLITELKMCEKE